MMNDPSRRKSPWELVELLVKHNPGASDELIAEVVSEWGELLEARPVEKIDPAAVIDLRPGRRSDPKEP
jgi:hypothetical protein